MGKSGTVAQHLFPMKIRDILLFKKYQRSCRRKRGEIFKRLLTPLESDRILDLGGEGGGYIRSILPEAPLIFSADIDPDMIRKSSGHGVIPVLLNENEPLPFPDNHFDIVFCSSVIEHVTVIKKEMEQIVSGSEFKRLAAVSQTFFADEIRRVGKSYFVQTPYKYFPLESHSRLPVFLVLLPRSWQIRLIRFFNRFWIARTHPDWNLLTVKDMKALFPEAEIIKERIFGFTKSIMAVKRKEPEKR